MQPSCQQAEVLYQLWRVSTDDSIADSGLGITPPAPLGWNRFKHDALEQGLLGKGFSMSRMLAAKLLFACATLIPFAGCANRAGWGFGSGQGTVERQKARAVVHDPYPLNDIGPPVMGGRPREYFDPQAEVTRNHAVDTQFPQSFGYGQ